MLVGGRTYSPPETVREFGGQKYAALVAAGHTVRLAISPRARRTHALTYADGVNRTRSLEDGVRVVTFEACGARARPQRRERPKGHVLVRLHPRERAAPACA